MFPSFHNSFVSKILPVTLFNPRFSKNFFPYPADCNRSPGEGWSTHLDLLLRISCPPLSAPQNQRHAMRFPGSPALRNGEYCYFHRRWRMTTVDLSHSAHHVTTEFVLPVLEDADSIQITLGQIMRMIVCRQVDTKSAGLLLYALQIASANLRRTQFEPYHRNVTVDLFRVPERVIGDEAWSPSDFKDANVGNVGRAPKPAKPSSDKESSPEKQSDVGRASPLAVPSPAKETAPTNESSLEKQLDVGRASPLAVPLSAEETHVARTPSSAKESCVVATLPEPQPGPPSPATQPAPASNVSSSSLPSATEQRELQKAVRAPPRRPEGRLARCKNTI